VDPGVHRADVVEFDSAGQLGRVEVERNVDHVGQHHQLVGEPMVQHFIPDDSVHSRHLAYSQHQDHHSQQLEFGLQQQVADLLERGLDADRALQLLLWRVGLLVLEADQQQHQRETECDLQLKEGRVG